MTSVRLALLAVLFFGCSQGDLDGAGGALTPSIVALGTLTPSDSFLEQPGSANVGVTIVADPWTITLTAGADTVDLCPRGTDAVGVLTPMIEVFGPGGFVGMATATSVGQGAVLTFTVNTPGVHTIVVRDATGLAPPQNVQGNYALRLDNGSTSTPCPL